MRTVVAVYIWRTKEKVREGVGVVWKVRELRMLWRTGPSGGSGSFWKGGNKEKRVHLYLYLIYNIILK
jgi:hypothetical protein